MSESHDYEGANLGASGVPTRTTERDLDAARVALEPWFRATLSAPDLVLGEVTKPGSSGVANETLLCEATFTLDGAPVTKGYVIRIASPNFLYKDVVFSDHFRMCQALEATGRVPAPHVIGDEPDPSYLGQHFYVMDKIEGQVPEDQPPYHTGGWVAELSPERRRVLWRNAVAAMAELHKVDPNAVSFLQRPELGASGLEQYLAASIDYSKWARSGTESPVIEAAEQWLLDNLPEYRPTELAWGDARIGNIIFLNEEVQAVLDWDQVSLAGAESDLAWWTIMELLYTDSAGVPRLEGIGSPAETIAEWERVMGRPAQDIWYQLVFAAYRMSGILIRLSSLLGAAGILPPELAEEMRTNNQGIQYLATMLDLPHDGTIVSPWPGLGVEE